MAALLAILAAGVVFPSFAQAAGPAVGHHLPTMGYLPAFVSEREDGPWEDCMWASAAMFLDKWTSGAVRIDRTRLRTLSGDLDGGSALADVRRAFDKVGLRLTWSPGGGATLSWADLLDRLALGGGAILPGDDGQLPARYGRWDPTFWGRTGTGDDHALYLDRYDRRTDAVFVMDPLAPEGWTGEWIPASLLRRFAWEKDGVVTVALTPPARTPAPLEGVSLGSANTSIDGSGVRVTWPVTAAAPGWTAAGVSLTADLTSLTAIDPTLAAVQAPAPRAPAVTADGTATATWMGPGPQPAQPMTATTRSLTSSLPMPAPGLYRVTMSITEDRSGRAITSLEPFALYVPGPRAAQLTTPGDVTIAPSGKVQIPVRISNLGAESWGPPPAVASLPPELQRGPELRLVGTWAWHPDPAGAPTSAPLPDPVRSVSVSVAAGSLELLSGETTVVSALLDAPAEPGSWRLLLDLVDGHGSSLATEGSRPALIDVQVVAPDKGTPVP
jgi:hypothetical protein